MAHLCKRLAVYVGIPFLESKIAKKCLWSVKRVNERHFVEILYGEDDRKGLFSI